MEESGKVRRRVRQSLPRAVLKPLLLCLSPRTVSGRLQERPSMVQRIQSRGSKMQQTPTEFEKSEWPPYLLLKESLPQGLYPGHRGKSAPCVGWDHAEWRGREGMEQNRTCAVPSTPGFYSRGACQGTAVLSCRTQGYLERSEETIIC